MTAADRVARMHPTFDAYLAAGGDDPEAAYQALSPTELVTDLIADALHYLQAYAVDFDPDTVVQNALVHWTAEQDPFLLTDEDAAEIAERAVCPDCGTVADIDGYCVDAGCTNVGKTVS